MEAEKYAVIFIYLVWVNFIEDRENFKVIELLQS